MPIFLSGSDNLMVVGISCCLIGETVGLTARGGGLGNNDEHWAVERGSDHDVDKKIPSLR